MTYDEWKQEHGDRFYTRLFSEKNSPKHDTKRIVEKVSTSTKNEKDEKKNNIISDAFSKWETSTSDEICGTIINNHEALADCDPKEIKELLENFGLDVSPLNKGNFAKIPFEEGGGYRVHFGSDGYFQYHPEERSHHHGAYWKVSCGKYGKNRFDMEGNQLFE